MEDSNRHFFIALWIVIIISIIVIVGLGIFAAAGLNATFPDLTRLLPL